MTTKRALEIICDRINCLEIKTHLFIHCDEECEKCTHNHSMNEEKDALLLCKNMLNSYLEDISHHTK